MQGQIIQIETENKAAKKFNGLWVIGTVGKRLHLHRLNKQHALLDINSPKNTCHVTAEVLSNYITAGWAQNVAQVSFEQLCNEFDAK